MFFSFFNIIVPYNNFLYVFLNEALNIDSLSIKQLSRRYWDF